MEDLTASFNLGNSGIGTAPEDVTPPPEEDRSDMSSNLINCVTWEAAKWEYMIGATTITTKIKW